MKISFKLKKRYIWILQALKRKKRKLAVASFLGLLLTLFLTQTHITINQTPSLTYMAFICFKNLKPHRGDFVSIQNHPTSYYEGIHYTKRLTGLPGDRVHLKNNQMDVGGILIGPLQKTTKDGKPLHPLQVTIVPQGYVFVSADHQRSFDSRYEEFSLVKEENIKGRCFGLMPVISYQLSVIGKFSLSEKQRIQGEK